MIRNPADLHVRFERSDAVQIPEGAAKILLLGPYEFVQITYTELRVSPDGLQVATFDADRDLWMLQPGFAMAHGFNLGDAQYGWSDVVIY